MRKWFVLSISILFLFGIVGGAAWSAQNSPKGKVQEVCPVLGGKIDKHVFVDYQGKRIYFCCAGCKEQFLKDPQEYLKKMQSEGVVPESSPGKTP